MMKQFYIFVLALFVSTLSFAQIQITSPQMPRSNDSFTYINALPTDFNNQVALNGANRFWVFDEQQSPISNLVEYKASNRTPYAFYFFNTVGQKIADTIGLGAFQLTDVYQFYSNTASEYKVEGIGFRISLAPIPLAGNFSNEDEIYFFPLQFGNRDSSSFRVRVSIPSIGAYSQTGYRITEVVGHGNAVVKGDTFSCLKVKSTIMSMDTVETQFIKFGFPNNRIEYKWLTLDYRAPIAEVTGTIAAGQFIPNLSRYLDVSRKPSNPGGGGTYLVKATEGFNSLTYPNPTNNQLYIDASVKSIQVFDLQGKIMEFSFQEGQMHFNWAPGLYHVILRLDNGTIRSGRVQVGE